MSEKKAMATSNQTKTRVTQENTKELLTAIDTATTSNETLAQVQARESWCQREVMKHVNVLVSHFVMRASGTSFQ